jgi:hypothetical protein
MLIGYKIGFAKMRTTGTSIPVCGHARSLSKVDYLPAVRFSKFQLAMITVDSAVPSKLSSHVLVPTRETSFHHSTSFCERFLLFATIVLLPIEDTVPTIAGYSILFLMFAALSAYVFLNHARSLGLIWLHPVFLSAYLFILLSFLVESAHPNPYYADVRRFFLMIVGGLSIASLCRDRRALRTCIYGYLVGSLWLSLVLIYMSYGALHSATATNFAQASAVRLEVTEELPIEGDLNAMALMAAQGAAVGLALTLTTSSLFIRSLFLGITMLCSLGTFMPMSRGGVVILGVSCIAVILAFGIVRMKAVMLMIFLGACLVSAVPNVVFSRMDAAEGSRRRIYTTALNQLPSYLVTGVGDGNYLTSWGYRHGFTSEEFGGRTLGTHNAFLQVTVFWGIAALLPFLALVWQNYRCLPKQCRNDPLGLCLPPIAVSLLFYLLVSHTFYDKYYSLGLGLFAAARIWIWPRGLVPKPLPN